MHHVIKLMHFYAANLFKHSAIHKCMVMNHLKFCNSFCSIFMIDML